MATEAGQAYVSIVPSARGLARSLRKTFEQEFDRSGVERMLEQQLSGLKAHVSVVPEVDQVDAVVDVRANTVDLRDQVATAVGRVERSLTADIVTQPAGSRAYERDLRTQVRDVAGRVKATVEVDVDVDKPLRSGELDDAGNSVGRSLASSVTSSMASGISLVPPPVLFAGAVAAAVVTGPIIGAALAGGILTAIGGGVIGLGIVALADDPRLKSAASDLAATIKGTLATAAAPLLGEPGKPGPLLQAMDILKQLVIDIGPSLQQMFAAIGPYIPGLAEGIAAFVKEAMPGLVEAVKAAGPILEVIALNLGPLGQALGGFLRTMAELAPAAADALNVIFFLLNQAIGLAATVIYTVGAAFSGWFQNLKDAGDNIAAAWERITGIFSGGTGSVKQIIEAFIGATIRLFYGLWGKLTGGAKGALSSVASTFGGLPGRIRSAVGNLGSLLYNAGRSVIQGLINGIRSMFSSLQSTLGWVTNAIPDWKGPMDKDRRLLEPAGTAIMGGLIRGIRGELPALRSELGSVTGLIAGAPLAATATGGYGLSTSATPAPRLSVEWVGGDGDPIIRAIRENTRIYYGGSAQAAIGT